LIGPSGDIRALPDIKNFFIDKFLGFFEILIYGVPRTCQTLIVIGFGMSNPKRDLGLTQKLLLLLVMCASFLPQQRCCFRWRRGCWFCCFASAASVLLAADAAAEAVESRALNGAMWKQQF
jgi:hypothetical protein